MIIATGGFADNPEMMKKYTRFPNTDGIAQTGKNGVGIQMAWSAGGGKEGLEVQQSYRPGPVQFPQRTMFRYCQTASSLADSERRTFLRRNHYGRLAGCR